ncbi:unnamed protein product [Caenorhabditis sp. 36 PRJEB53466]|nr:unnamed protein product [Caenorhabditis sp. 36 PRJEB53466]
MEIGSVEVTITHVGLGVGMFLVYLILSIICKQLKLRRERKVPNILRQFEKVPGLHTIRTPTHTLFCGVYNQAISSSVYTQDRHKVQRLLRTLFQNPNILVPETCVAVCIPTWCSTTGDRFHQFHCRPPAPYCPCPTIVSEYHYTYKMVSGRVQATFYHNRRCTCLAGICIYLRIADEPWFFGDLPESLVMDLIGPGVKRWITPRGSRRRRITVPLSVREAEEEEEEEAEEEEEEESCEESECEEIVVTSPPPPYSTISRTVRIEDHPPPPSYFALFSNATKL